jgi:hypothetical protein
LGHTLKIGIGGFEYGRNDLYGYDLSEIENINEELVIERMEKILNEGGSLCRCQLCIEDIFAL